MKKIIILTLGLSYSLIVSGVNVTFGFGSPVTQNVMAETKEAASQETVPSPEFVSRVLDTEYKSVITDTALPAEAARELSLNDTITIINRTVTPLGIWALSRMTRPTELSTVLQRQAVVKQLTINADLYTAMVQALSGLKSVATDILPYFNEHDPLQNEARRLYFNFAPTPKDGTQLSRIQRLNAFLNSNSISLECGPYLNFGIFASQFAIQFAVQNISSEFLRNQEQSSIKSVSRFRSIFDGLVKTAATPFVVNWPWLYRFKNHQGDQYIRESDGSVKLAQGQPVLSNDGIYRINEERYGANFSIADRALDFEKRLNITPESSYLASLGCTAAIDFVTGYTIYQQIKSLNESNKIINHLRMRLTRIATIIKETEKLYQACTRSPLMHGLQPVATLRNFLENPPTDVAELINVLHTTTFAESDSLFYRRGRVLYAHKKLSDIKNQLLPLLRAISEIDAYISVATLVKEHASLKNTYCFVTFDTTRNHPRAELTDFWLPLITSHEPVLNTLIIGDTHANSLLLAGPNGSGKSTFMKSIAYNWAILPLSWGIAAAQKAHVTPINAIRTSINIHENILEGKSTYMAQSERFDQILSLVENAQTGHTLLLVDEPLNGTVESIAAQRTIELGMAVAQRPHCCAVIATHLEKPTHLDELTGAFNNYYPEVLEETPGDFRQTYRLLPGKAEWWFNDISKQDRFDRWLKRRMTQALYQ